MKHIGCSGMAEGVRAVFITPVLLSCDWMQRLRSDPPVDVISAPAVVDSRLRTGETAAEGHLFSVFWLQTSPVTKQQPGRRTMERCWKHLGSADASAEPPPDKAACPQ